MKQIIRSTTRLSFLLLLCAQALAGQSSSVAYDALKKTYLTTLNASAPEKELSKLANEMNPWRRYSMVTEQIFRAYELKQESEGHAELDGHVDVQMLNDLELFSSKGIVAAQGGHDESKPRCIADGFDRTLSVFGKVMLHKTLVDAAAGVQATKEAIEVRQNATRALAEDSQLLSSVERSCKHIGEAEQSVLAMWQEHAVRDAFALGKITAVDATKTDAFTALMNSYAVARQQKAKDGVVDVLEGHKTIQVIQQSYFAAFSPLILPGIAYASYRVSQLKGISENDKGQALVNAVVIGSMSPLMVWQSYKILLQNIRHYKAMQALLQDWEAFFDGAEKLAKTVESSPELKALLAQQPYASFDILRNKDNALYRKVKSVREKLCAPAVQDSSFLATFRRYVGTAFGAYVDLFRLRNELAPLMEAVGLVDAYRSAAQVYTENAEVTLRGSEANCYSFVKFVSDDLPRFEAAGVWNPMLDITKAVASDFSLGGKLTAKNAIVSGPNAGGKSTTLRAIMTSVLLAQGFGIAPARSLTMTPFSKLITYFDILDSTADGNSLFKSEVIRAKQLKDLVKNLQPGERAFLMVDELFRGTDAAVAASLSKALVKYIGSQPRSMLVLASHFKATTGLEAETNGRFKNFHVSAFVNPIKYPYKLYEGATTQNIAFNLLEEDGFDLDGIVKEAREYYMQIAPIATA